ncbi:hypothetical protein TNIN_311881 [Trichonephila inaurata madagascariensis]|uniref:Uncharacterized protein n=1 Tax=Trichonephila inaurata madagascariensis TaxID=2747483 RepID=A0A8X6IDF3_9ARAC|nr:hypothetical protein TNIN_311881 [Trichonephila inaurata madagascariensis]
MIEGTSSFDIVHWPIRSSLSVLHLESSHPKGWSKLAYSYGTSLLNCTKCCITQAASDHILGYMMLFKQDIISSPLIDLDFLLDHELGVALLAICGLAITYKFADIVMMP